MLCCGKKSKKKVCRKEEIRGAEVNLGFVEDSLRDIDAVGDRVLGGEAGEVCVSEQEQVKVKGILLQLFSTTPGGDNTLPDEKRKQARSASFSLYDDVINPDRLKTIPEEARGAQDDVITTQELVNNQTGETRQAKSMMSNQVPAITKPAPVFRGTAVVDGQFKEISLEDYKGKYIVLFFYPLDFTFVCPTEIIAFSDRVEEFRNIGCEVVACSTDSHFSHLAWVNTPRKEGGLGAMNIPLLADKSMEISKAYGATINDLPVGRDVDETLRLVQAFQFVEEHGEVCPAGWRPGGKTMKADPSGSKEYFQSEN
ncbi:Peroxiredoxin 1-like [Homarus americanus]|uniref:thioredoxin-dependent peroxiredoxin n=1 Tax=Homarus americanus TaxID=6706 RepID=A0A8J5TNF2_HOMAM|nr:Peroxiredoxin 1-like [Homarus americanus]